MTLHFIPPALRHRRFRLLWLGLMISIAGSRMQVTAVLWHVHQINGQPIALGGVGLVRILPVLFFSLLAGAIADRLNRRNVMFLTQTLLATLSATLGIITQQGWDSLVWIYLLIAISGAVQAFDLPARQALVPNLVPREELTNAFSLMSIAGQVGSIAGPALGGLVIAGWGTAYAYYIDAVSFGAVILALILMGAVAQNLETQPGRGLRSIIPEVRDGLRYVFHQPIIFSSMVLDFFATFFSSASTLLPIFAEDILAVGPQGYGLLSAAPSIGAVSMAILMSMFDTIRRQGKVLLLAVAGFGLSTLVFGISRSFTLSFVALATIGASDSLSTIIRNTIRQLQTPDSLRGRMTSINQIFFMGGPELGELEAGIVAQLFSVPFSVISGGIGCLLAASWTAARFPQLRSYNGDEPMLAGGRRTT